MLFRCDLTLRVKFSLLSRVVGWVGGWRAMLNSTQDQVEVEVEVRVELGKNEVLQVW